MMFKPSTVLYAVLGLATFGNAAAVPAEGVEASTPNLLEKRVWLSNVDVQQACKDQVNPNASAIRKGNSCSDWKCLYANVEYSVNMAVYCSNRHGVQAYAACGGGTVWDWQCHDRT
ncbi:hypothetical protein B0T21DRAFT_359103 [Apiosordaria backusii]|uniref:Secreted protein n=1 Tax=Apiosordaria backusii TaxID=314023 RepID=A0AA40K439_9PEZI|nr:hypothetical protein B0T21DRAFT_359103 [Apiosordaria backusii]